MSDNTNDTPMDYKQQPLSEKDEAIRMANKALDVPNADPDDDLRTISRQFLRLYDVYRKQTESLLNAVDSIVIQISRLKSANDPILNPVIEDLETILKGPIPTRWSDENASLKLELQKQKEEIQRFELERTEMYHKYEKQKELNAELVKIKNLVEDLIEVPHFRNQWETTTEAFESLIKKSSEI